MSLRIGTERLIITELTEDMAPAIQRQSQDEATRRFLPDEVFDTVEAAQETVRALINAYQFPDGPFVYAVGQRCPSQTSAGYGVAEASTAVLAPSRAFGPPSVVGYVQLCRVREGWEIGYHIGEAYRGRGFASESVRAFLPEIMARLGLRAVWGVVAEENAASCRVLEKCGFALIERGEGLYHGEMRPRRLYRYVP